MEDNRIPLPNSCCPICPVRARYDEKGLLEFNAHLLIHLLGFRWQEMHGYVKLEAWKAGEEAPAK